MQATERDGKQQSPFLASMVKSKSENARLKSRINLSDIDFLPSATYRPQECSATFN